MSKTSLFGKQLKESQESMDRCTDCHNITETLLKMVLNTTNQSIDQSNHTISRQSFTLEKVEVVVEKGEYAILRFRKLLDHLKNGRLTRQFPILYSLLVSR